jgi:polyhydroxybutyrate depolymerase
VPYAGGNPVLNVGLQGTLDFPSVAASVGRWREIDGCAATSTVLFKNGDTTCNRWGCAQGSEVVLCTIDGGGHTWPGGLPIPFLGKTSTDIDTTEAIISFFAAHPMP